jgi:MerR family transcriptional regulator, thiopeptide resistance regulator
MGTSSSRTYRTAEFAKLAGVTARALHHYDRLGLLEPRRSDSGYRLYVEADLETLEQIVALKFIGVPLKRIAALRQQSKASFEEILRAQRHTLEEQQSQVRRAIAAIEAAEASLRAGATIEPPLFRRIIEEMTMDTNQEATIARYSALLKAKIAHMMAMTPEQRTALHAEWRDLVQEITGALDEDPAGPKAQSLVNRWIRLLEAVSGASGATLRAEATDLPLPSQSPQLRDKLWARRAEWMPGSTSADLDEPAESDKERIQKAMQAAFPDRRVWEFIKRARDAGK